MSFFSGTFENKVDGKSRISVPAPFRSALSNESGPAVYLYASPNYPAIEACSPEFMAKMENAVKSMPLWSPQRELLETAIIAPSRRIGLDDDGRLVLPKDLKEIAEVTDKATFLGKGSRFEIWNPIKAAEAVIEARRKLLEGGFQGVTGLEGL